MTAAIPVDAAPVTRDGRITGVLRRLVRGQAADARWVRPCLIVLLGATAILYLWGLGRNGWANDFYSAAVQAGSKSWKAFFFGSSDAGNTITVDKPPATLWPMALSVRLFGLNAWSMLVPQALMGVATVATVYATVRRWFTAGAGLIAGLVMALTPVAVLMFRFNNPDALLTLLMALAAYTALRAVEEDRYRWYILTGVLVGFGFLTKQLQVMLVVPGFALVLLVAGNTTFWHRVRGLLVAGIAVLLAAGWWVAIVELVPASARPYIGGTQHNSFLELTFGYNGLGRLTGNESSGIGGGALGGGGPGGAGGPPGGGGFGGSTGVTRMFSNAIGGQISWLLPAALIALVVGLVWCGRARRTDMRRASLLVWGTWLCGTALVFSYMSGIFHEYYTVALAPPVAALVGIGAAMAWQRRDHWTTWVVLAATTAITTWWAFVLLGRAAGWNSWLRPTVFALGAVATLGMVAAAVSIARSKPPERPILVGICTLAGLAALVGPTAWAIQTLAEPRTGSIVTAGPSVSGSGAFPGGGGFPGGGTAAGDVGSGFPAGDLAAGDLPADVEAMIEEMQASGEAPDLPTGGPGGIGGGDAQPGGFAGGGIPGGGGAQTVSQQVIDLLMQDADSYTWVAATMGATSAAPYQLATDRSVMPIGGFSSSDPAPTLEQFRADVTAKRIHWFIGGQFGGFGATEAEQSISSWVADNFDAVTVDGVTLYDLTATPHGA